MERKKLLSSQKELLRMKREKVNEASAFLQQKQGEVQIALNNIATELGVPKDELNKWAISANDDYLELQIEQKKPRMLTVKKKKHEVSK